MPTQWVVQVSAKRNHWGNEHYFEFECEAIAYAARYDKRVWFVRVYAGTWR